MSPRIAFTTYPVRFVPLEPAPTRWTVTIHRAGAWPGWPWLDRVPDRHWFWNPLGGAPEALRLLAVPSMIARRLAYAVRRRTDWDVLVYDRKQIGHEPRRARLVEHLPTQAAAAARAETLWKHLCDHDALPGPQAWNGRSFTPHPRPT